MSTYKVAELFTGIVGNGRRAGELAVIVRLCGCNLGCTFCDHEWVNELNVSYTPMTEDEITEEILQTGVDYVVLTGGEPLLSEDIETLIERIMDEKNLDMEIQTNGTISIAPYDRMARRPHFLMEYKLPSSGMTRFMNSYNFEHLKKTDTVMFQAASKKDLQTVKSVMDAYSLTRKCRVILTPVAGQLDADEVADFMKKNTLNGVELQLQLEKLLWGSDEEGE